MLDLEDIRNHPIAHLYAQKLDLPLPPELAVDAWSDLDELARRKLEEIRAVLGGAGRFPSDAELDFIRACVEEGLADSEQWSDATGQA